MADVDGRGIVILPGMMLDGRAFPGLSERLRGYGDVTVGDLTQDNSIATMAARVLASAPARFAVIGSYGLRRGRWKRLSEGRGVSAERDLANA